MIIYHKSKQPKARGVITEVKKIGSTYIGELTLFSGQVLQGEFFSAGTFSGTILSIDQQLSNGKILIARLEGSPVLQSGSSFRVYSTINISNIALLAELTIIFLIFYNIFARNKNFRFLTVILWLITYVFWIYVNIVKEEIHSFNGFFAGWATIVVIISSLSYFYTQLNTLDAVFIYKELTFWLVSAILIYKSATFFLYLYTTTLDQSEKAKFYIISSVSYIIQNVFFAIGFLNNQTGDDKPKRV